MAILPVSSLGLSAEAAAAQPIVAAGLFPAQLQLYKPPWAGGLLDADGCVSISTSGSRISATVMYAQSNHAALSNLAHTFHSLGVDISNAAIHRVDDLATGRYVHEDKVHLLYYKAGPAAQLAGLLAPNSGMKSRQLQLLATKWRLVGSMGRAARSELAAECRQLNATAHQPEHLNTAVLRDEQVRPA